ncbi:IPT/TIG domain-containing protein [Caldanaerobius fijiensis DSM 17918]|uniref:IPT/TIG domain-containing protein n=1 Tax=Caldanaerobius fijiensis DSM 17918 TaxID=1121256 RepID=A0A1M4URH3_9THEO|nr:IPT/TIG domain-containing protein [Caldanaerobius fijiensis]SHE59200.1 IPT/TIG domain-containing protein [Caldanaerobius fijiensis DSM 17918]
MRRIVALLLSMFIAISATGILLPRTAVASSGDVSMNPTVVSSADGGYVVLTALNGKYFDSNTVITVTYGSNSVTIDSKDINITPNQILVKIPPANGYVGDAWLIIKPGSSTSTGISDILQFKYVSGSVISVNPTITNIYQNVETTFVRDTSGRIIGSNKILQTVIEGKNFDLKEVKIGSLSSAKKDTNGNPELQLIYADSEKIVIKTPTDIMSGDIKDITVINNDNGQDVKSFKYNVTPYIYYIDKSKAYPGLKVTITGDNFRAQDIQWMAISNTKLSYDSYSVLSGQKIEFTVPVGMDPGVKDIVISQAGSDNYGADFGGTRVTLKGEFTVVQTPPNLSIQKVEPNAGPTSGGTITTITGAGFVDSLQVYIGDANNLDQYLKDSSNKHLAKKLPLLSGQDAYSTIRVQIPPLPSGENPGPKDVILYNQLDGTFYVFSGGFTYLTVGNQLTIDTVYPMEMRETSGTRTINVQGRNIKNFNIDKFTAVSDSVYAAYDNNTDEYIVRAKGQYYDNQNVSIEKRIKLNIGNNLKITDIEGDDNGIQTITAEMPPFTLNPRQDTPVDVILTTHTVIIDAQGKTLLDITEQVIKAGFTLKPDLTTPQIVDITPPVGSREGGYAVTIKGIDVRDGAKVYFGDIQAQVKSIDAVFDSVYKKISSTLVVIVPPSKTIGKVPVKIVNTEGGTTDINDPKAIFTYQTAPKISSITPAVGEVNKDIYVTIKGSEFYVAPDGKSMPKVRVHYKEYNSDGTVAQDVYGEFEAIQVTDDKGNPIDGRNGSFGTQLQVKISSSYIGYHDVEVINPDYVEGSTGARAVANNAFVFKKPEKDIVVNSVTPSKGKVDGGTPITVNGANFGLKMMVTIDGRPATNITRVDQTQIKATTPPGTSGLKPVQVIDLDTGSTFTYYDPSIGKGFKYVSIVTDPSISSIAPDHGTEGTWVYIKGKDFVQEVKDNTGKLIASKSTVYIGDMRVPDGDVYVIDSGLIKFKVPQMPEPMAYDITVENPDGSVTSSPAKFQYMTPSQDTLPSIEGIEPPIGPVNGGNIAIIKGKNFKDGIEVYFGSEKAKVVAFDMSKIDADGFQSISVVVPPSRNGAGYVDVIVVNYDGGSDTLVGGYRYAIPNSSPVVTSVQPNKGSTLGGDVVIIKGKDFRRISVTSGGSTVQKVPDVFFGGTKAESVKYIDEFTLEVTTPAYPNGQSVDVTVVNPADDKNSGGVTVLKNGYTYTQSKPVITDIIPPAISVKGGVVLIKGSNFTMRRTGSDGKTIMSVIRIHDGANIIQLPKDINDPRDDSVTVIDASTIVVKIPELESQGDKIIEVINPDGGTATGKLKAVIALSNPLISRISPQSGSINGGTRVTIYGQDLRKTAKVYFGNNEAQVIQHADDNSYIVVLTPKVTEDYAGKSVGVLIDNGDGGSAYKADAFMYLKTSANPTINRIVPNTGSTNGGDRVTIYGSGFQYGVQVYFDGVLASNPQVINDNTAITVITPSGREGLVDVTVRNPDGSEATLKGGYKYIVTNPETPIGFYAYPQSGDTVKLGWSSSKGALKYELYIKESYNDQWIFVTSVDASTNTYYVHGLTPNTSYSFQLRAINSSGMSNTVTTGTTTLKAGSESSSPGSSTGDSTANSIEVDSGVVVVTLGISGANEVNLTGAKYRGVDRYIINIPQRFIGQDKYFNIYYEGGKIGFNTKYIWGAGDVDYVVLELNRMGGNIEERASISVGRAYKLMSDVYDVNTYVQNGNKKVKADDIIFYYDLMLSYSDLKYWNNIHMYYYDPDADKWKATIDDVSFLGVSSSQYKNGRFALFSEVK